MELKLNYEQEKYESKWQDKSLPLWVKQEELEAVMKCRDQQDLKALLKMLKKLNLKV